MLHIRSMAALGSVRPGTGLPPKSSSRMAGICPAPAELRTNAGLRCGKIWEVTLCPACGYYGASLEVAVK